MEIPWKLELLYDPSIPFLAVDPEKMKTLIWKGTYTSNVHRSTNSHDKEAI